MKPIIWYIHGANSTPASFRFIKDRLPEHDFNDVAYDCTCSVQRVIESLVAKAENEPRPIHMVGHSLGGLIAVATAQRTHKVEKVATVASPFGGSKLASLLRWIYPSYLLEDIHPVSPLILSIQRDALTVPVMSIVTTSGHTPLISELNDGVVTIASQQTLKGPVYIPVQKNHFECLMSEQVTDLLTGFLFEE